MKKSRNSVTADHCRIEPSSECVAPRGERWSANHTIPKARRSTPQAERGGVLPEDSHEMSLGALWDHLNRTHRTPQTTIEAVVHSVRDWIVY